MLRWIYIALSIAGVFAVMHAFDPKGSTLSHVVWTVPGVNFGLTIGLLVVCGVGGLAVARLKLGK